MMYRKLLFVLLALFLAACTPAGEVSDAAIENAIAQTAEAQAHLDEIVAATLAAIEAEVTPSPEIIFTSTPEMPAFNYTGWQIFDAPDGYTFYYPPNFIAELRDNGRFIAVLEEDVPPNTVSFSIERLADTELVTIKEEIELDEAVFTELAAYGMNGFTVDGIVPGDGFGGGSRAYGAYFLLGEDLIHLSCPWNYCDREQFLGVLRSFSVKE